MESLEKGYTKDVECICFGGYVPLTSEHTCNADTCSGEFRDHNCDTLLDVGRVRKKDIKKSNRTHSQCLMVTLFD